MYTVVVRLADNQVVDCGLGNISRDSNTFDNMTFETSPIPAGENIYKYHRDGQGAIVKKPFPQLLAEFPDEYAANVKAKWVSLKGAIPDTEPWKQALIDLATSLGWE